MQIGGALLKYLYSDWKTGKKKKRFQTSDLKRKSERNNNVQRVSA